VAALLTDRRRKSSEKEISAFATPTVVHFVAALVSAALSAPWPSVHGAAIAAGATGVVGLVYVSGCGDITCFYDGRRGARGERVVLGPSAWGRPMRRCGSRTSTAQATMPRSVCAGIQWAHKTRSSTLSPTTFACVKR
jgi:hypothetical protein